MCNGSEIMDGDIVPYVAKTELVLRFNRTRGSLEFSSKGNRLGVLNEIRGADLRICCYVDGLGSWTIMSCSACSAATFVNDLSQAVELPGSAPLQYLARLTDDQLISISRKEMTAEVYSECSGSDYEQAMSVRRTLTAESASLLSCSYQESGQFDATKCSAGSMRSCNDGENEAGDMASITQGLQAMLKCVPDAARATTPALRGSADGLARVCQALRVSAAQSLCSPVLQPPGSREGKVQVQNMDMCCRHDQDIRFLKEWGRWGGLIAPCRQDGSSGTGDQASRLGVGVGMVMGSYGWSDCDGRWDGCWSGNGVCRRNSLEARPELSAFDIPWHKGHPGVGDPRETTQDRPLARVAMGLWDGPGGAGRWSGPTRGAVETKLEGHNRGPASWDSAPLLPLERGPARAGRCYLCGADATRVVGRDSSGSASCGLRLGPTQPASPDSLQHPSPWTYSWSTPARDEQGSAEAGLLQQGSRSRWAAGTWAGRGLEDSTDNAGRQACMAVTEKARDPQAGGGGQRCGPSRGLLQAATQGAVQGLGTEEEYASSQLHCSDDCTRDAQVAKVLFASLC